MKTARCRVRTRTELATCVQLGEYNFNARKAGFRLDVYWNASSGVSNLDALVFVQNDRNRPTVATESLVDAVVDDLPETVHKPARVG